MNSEHQKKHLLERALRNWFLDFIKPFGIDYIEKNLKAASKRFNEI